MKKQLLLISIISCFNIVKAQTVSLCPLHLSTIHGFADILSAPSHDVLWAGIEGYNGSYYNCKKFALTTDAGNTFRIDSIPETENRGFSCIWALDGLTAWAGMQDFFGVNGGDIWKTTDGGNTWTKQTNNTQFAGGYLDYIAFFTPDSGVAFGDPNGGYYEIYTTTNGGTTWTRVPQSNIPPGISGEFGLFDNVNCVAQNGIWCVTNLGRVYYSRDRGYHWQVSTVKPLSSSTFTDVSMTDSLNGAACEPPWMPEIWLTSDGGATWSLHSGLPIATSRVSAIKNVTGAFVYKDPYTGIYATTDNFNTNFPITTNTSIIGEWSILMYDGSIGWSDHYNPISDSALIKISNVVTGINSGNTFSNLSSLNVFPNPIETGYALISFQLKKDAGVKLSLHDVSGKELRTQTEKGKSGSNAAMFDFKNISQGLYLLRLDDGESYSVAKVIIK